MNFKEAINKIESREFRVYMNFASNLEAMFAAAKSQEAVVALQRELGLIKNRETLLKRVIELSNQHTDVRYENPWDTALTIYSWLLSFVDLELAKIAADSIISAQRCWWGAMLAQKTLSDYALKNDAKSEQPTFFLSADYCISIPACTMIIHNPQHQVFKSSLVGESLLHASFMSNINFDVHKLVLGNKENITWGVLGSLSDVSSAVDYCDQTIYEQLNNNSGSNAGNLRLAA